MIACAVSGSMPNVGGSSAASSTPSRPLVPGPDENRSPTMQDRPRHNRRTARDAELLALNRREHVSVEQHHLDDLNRCQHVDLRLRGFFTASVARSCHFNRAAICSS